MLRWYVLQRAVVMAAHHETLHKQERTRHQSQEAVGTAVCLSFGPIEKYFMFSVTSACARRTGAAAAWSAGDVSACSARQAS